MLRWAGFAIFSAGFLVFTAANAADHANTRGTSGNRQVNSIERTAHVRHVSAQKSQKPALKRKYAKTAKQKAVKQKVAGKAKAQRARLSVFDAGRPVAKGGGNYRLGAPYKIGGLIYTPKHDPNYRAEGKASWYGGSFHGRRTANGELFDMDALSAAHPTLPLPSYVRVTNLENNRSIIVRLNDRGPYRGGRLIDVSVRTAKLLGFYDQGLAQVRVEYVARAELAGSDDVALAASLLRQESPQAVQLAAAAPAPAESISRSQSASAVRSRFGALDGVAAPAVYDPDLPPRTGRKR